MGETRERRSEKSTVSGLCLACGNPLSPQVTSPTIGIASYGATLGLDTDLQCHSADEIAPGGKQSVTKRVLVRQKCCTDPGWLRRVWNLAEAVISC